MRYKRPRTGQSLGGHQLGTVGSSVLLSTSAIGGEGAAESSSAAGAEDGRHSTVVANQAILWDSTGFNLYVLNVFKVVFSGSSPGCKETEEQQGSGGGLGFRATSTQDQPCSTRRLSDFWQAGQGEIK